MIPRIKGLSGIRKSFVKGRPGVVGSLGSLRGWFLKLKRLARRLEPVPDPRLRDDVFGLVTGLNLLPQLVDEDAQVFRLLHALATPYCIEQHSVRQDFAGMACHKNEEFKFLGREMDLLGMDANLPRFRIDMKMAFIDRL